MSRAFFLRALFLLFHLQFLTFAHAESDKSLCAVLFDRAKAVAVDGKSFFDQVAGKDFRFNYDPERLQAQPQLGSKIHLATRSAVEKLEALLPKLPTPPLWLNSPKLKFDKKLIERVFDHVPLGKRKWLRQLLFSSTWDTLSLAAKDELLSMAPMQDRETWQADIKVIFNSNHLEKIYIYFDSVLALRRPTLEQKASPGLIKSFSLLGQTVGKSIVDSFTWLLNPTPYPIHFFDNRTKQIFKKIKRNPDKELNTFLSAQEIEHLVKTDLVEDAALYSLQRDGSGQFRQGLSRGLDILFTGSTWIFVRGALIAGTANILMTMPVAGYVTPTIYLAEVETESAIKVEVLLDTTGFPHTALRIGRSVINPGQTTVSVIPVVDYFATQPGNSMRTIQTIELNLSPEQLLVVQKAADEIAWMHYNNNTGFYDCTTVIADILREAGFVIPVVVDASPSLMFSYLKAATIAESESPEIHFVQFGSSQSRLWVDPITSLTRSVEAKLFAVLSIDVATRQSEIRKKEKLFFTNEVQSEFFTSLLQDYKIRFSEVFYSEIQLIEILSIRSDKDPNNIELLENLQAAKTELRILIETQISFLQTQWDQESDVTLRKDLLIQIEALMSLHEENI